MATTLNDDRFSIPLPGGKVARVPLSVLEQYVDPDARLSHSGYDCPDDDVTAHSMSIDATTGGTQWHTEWELGPADYTDESGFPQSAYVWHRHPLGTEYTEIYTR
jgi:hypothetical protein